MPLLESKKTKLQQFVSVSDWLEMKKKGWDKKFTIIDDSDITPVSIKQAMDVPEAMDFMKEEIKDSPREMYLEKKTIKELQAMCTELEIEFENWKTKKPYIDLLIEKGI